MAVALTSLIRDPAVFLSLAIEETASVLWHHLASFRPGEGAGVSNSPNRFNRHNYFEGRHGREFGDHAEAIDSVLKEGWAWLVSEGLLIHDGNDNYFVSRRARAVGAPLDIAAYKRASLLQRAHLHPIIAEKVYPTFVRGDYETSVFQAMREIEMRVRDLGEFPADLVGVKLMRVAFRPVGDNTTPGPLTDESSPAAEQEAVMAIFAGVMGFYKNSTGHRHVPTDATDAAEVIGYAGHLLRLIERR